MYMYMYCTMYVSTTVYYDNHKCAVYLHMYREGTLSNNFKSISMHIIHTKKDNLNTVHVHRICP